MNPPFRSRRADVLPATKIERPGDSRRSSEILADPTFRRCFALSVFLIGSLSAGQAETYTVTNTASTGQGSLSDAITQANNSSASTVFFASGLGTISLTSGLPDISSSLTLTGTGNAVTSGSGISPVLNVTSVGPGAVAVSLHELTVKGSNGTNGNDSGDGSDQASTKGGTGGPGGTALSPADSATGSVIINNSGTLFGGAGGTGGNANGFYPNQDGRKIAGDGGDGGGGSAAISRLGTATASTQIINTGTIKGGNGGHGGRARINATITEEGPEVFALAGKQGDGGDGADAITLSGTATITNSGLIQAGGGGGAIGDGAFPDFNRGGHPGAGGTGISLSGSDAAVNNESGGVIQGAIAINLSGSNGTVTNASGGLIQGGTGIILSGSNGTVVNEGGGTLRGLSGGVAIDLLSSATGQATIANAGAILGDNGGAGATYTDAGGGSSAINLSGNSATVTNKSGGVIQGGNGGKGGHWYNGPGHDGMGGGAGISLSGSNETIVNRGGGLIQGGNGGEGGEGVDYNLHPLGIFGAGGDGGAAISFSAGSATVINSGTISGGFKGGSTTERGNAIEFTGDNNRLELQDGSVLQGNVVVSGNGKNNVLALGGETNGSLNDHLTGFNTLLKTGSSVWTLNGTYTFSESIALAEGVLNLGNNGAIGSTGTLSFTGGTLQFSAANTTDYSTRFATTANQLFKLDTNGQNITLTSNLASTGGSLTKLGAGTLTLTGTNSFSGGVILSAGTLELGSNSAAGSGRITINGGGIRASGAPHTVTNALALNGDFILGRSTNFTGDVVLGANITITSANATASGTGTSGFGGVISGDHSLTLTEGANPTGTLLLTGDNTYTGATTVTGGTVQIGDGTQGSINGSSSLTVGTQGTVVFKQAPNSTIAPAVTNGGKVEIIQSSGSTNTFNGAVTGTGSFAQTGSGTTIFLANLSQSGGISTGSGGTLQMGNGGPGKISDGGTTGSLSGNVADGGTLAFNRSDGLIVSGDISGTGSVSQLGTGTSTLTGNNSYSGGLTISAGTLELGSDSAAGTGIITINGGGIRAAGDARTLDNALALNGDFTLGRATNFSGDAVLGANITITSANPDDQDPATSTFGGVISGNHRITLAAGTNPIGTIVFSGANRYSGGTTILGGEVRVENASALGTGAVTLSGGTLDLTGYSLTNTLGPVIAGNLTGGSMTNNGGNYEMQKGSVSTVLAGTNSLTKTTDGTVLLSGANTYSGGTTIRGGELKMGHAAALGAGAITISGGTLNLTDYSLSNLLKPAVNGNLIGGTITNNGGNYDLQSGSVSTILAGSNTLSKTRTGTVLLTGENTYTGKTILSGGVLQVGDGISGSIAATKSMETASGATLAFNQADGTTIAQDIVNNGRLMGAQAAGNTNTLSGKITGAGDFAQTGPGTTILTGKLDLYGIVSIAKGGTLQVGNGGTTGTLVGGADNEGTLAFDRSDNISFTGGVSGTGGILKLGTGRLYLSGISSYAGGLTISAGTVALASPEAAGSGKITINGGGIAAEGLGLYYRPLANALALNGDFTMGGLLNFSGNAVLGKDLTITSTNLNGTDKSTFSGTISGDHGLTLAVGAAADGALVFSGNNTYTGGTTLNGGTLMAGHANAFGSGRFTQTGGTLQTNNLNHLMAIGGNFTQTSGTLLINLNGAPEALTNDRLQVQGTASLLGKLAINYKAGSLAPSQSQTYTVIETKGGILDVNAAGYDLPDLRAGALLIDVSGAVVGDDFQVTVKGKQLGYLSLGGVGVTPEQRVIGAYLDTLGLTIPDAALPLFIALNEASVDPAALNAALEQLTPLPFGNFTSTTAFNTISFATQQFDGYLSNRRAPDGTFASSSGGIDCSGFAVNNPNIDTGLQMVHSRLLAWNPAPSTGLISDVAPSLMSGLGLNETAPSASANPWNAFISGNVIFAESSANGAPGLSDTHATTGAVQVGADYRITPHVLVGAMFGYGHTSSTLDGLGSKAKVDTYTPGVYASYSDSGWYANGLANYGFANYSQSRNVSIGAFQGTANSSPTGDQITGNLDGGYDFHRGPWTFGPTVGLQYVHLTVDSYSETGLPVANLAVDQAEADSLRSRVGGRVAYAVQTGGFTLTPHASASWQHEFMDQSRGISSQFVGLGVGSFVVNTPNPSRESALVEAGLDAQINQTVTVFGNYTAQVGQSNYFGQSVQAGVKIGF